MKLSLFMLAAWLLFTAISCGEGPGSWPVNVQESKQDKKNYTVDTTGITSVMNEAEQRSADDYQRKHEDWEKKNY